MSDASKSAIIGRASSLGDVFRAVKSCECDPFLRIEAAYWALVHCHWGPRSWQYAAMCRLGDVFSPGISSERMTRSTEAYQAACNALLGE